MTCLRQTPAAVVAIVVDVLEEEHNRDTLPRLGRRDQDAMLARKLARMFPRTAYRTAAVQGRLPDDPQTSRILLSGLSKADHLRTLQELLAEARLPVSTVVQPGTAEPAAAGQAAARRTPPTPHWWCPGSGRAACA